MFNLRTAMPSQGSLQEMRWTKSLKELVNNRFREIAKMGCQARVDGNILTCINIPYTHRLVTA